MTLGETVLAAELASEAGPDLEKRNKWPKYNLSGTKIASQNRSDHGGRKLARNHSAAEIAGFFCFSSRKNIACR